MKTTPVVQGNGKWTVEEGGVTGILTAIELERFRRLYNREGRRRAIRYLKKRSAR